MAQENGIPPFLGCWLSSMVLSPLAISLTYRATNDIGVMVNFDWITEPVQKLINRVLNNTEKTDLEDQRDEINEN
nr:hypothetical protein [Flavobacterium sp. N1946]